MTKKYSIAKILLTVTVIFFVVGYIVYPLCQLLAQSFSEKGTYTQLFDKTVLTACFNSILLSVISVIGSAIIGVWLAYIFQYKKFAFKSFFSTMALLPIAIPPMVGVMCFLFLLGENGLLLKFLPFTSFKFDGWFAIIALHLYSFYPLFFLFTGAAFTNLDNSTVEASYTLGAGKLKTFYSIILPQLLPSLIGASLLTFMASMASFSAPFIFGGADRFLTTAIYYAKINGDNSYAAVLSILLTVISIIFLAFLNWYRNKQPLTGRTKGAIKSTISFDNKNHDHGTFTIVIIFCVAIALPIISLFILSLIPEGSLMQPGLNYSYSLDNFKNIFTDNDALQPFFNSIESSTVAILFTLIIGLAVAYIVRGKKNLFKSSVEIIISLPYGIPGTVIAICLILSFNAPNAFSFNNILVGTFWILPIAYTIRNIPILSQAIISGLHSIDPSIEEASATLGATNFKTWRSITLPLIYPSIIQGSLLVFINSFGEFVATILLYNYSTKTISVEVYSQLRLYNDGIAAAYGVIIFLIILCIVFFSRRALDKSTTINNL
jgi:iron(III) transport system permease protein